MVQHTKNNQNNQTAPPPVDRKRDEPLSAQGQYADIIEKGKQEWEKTVDAIDDIITILDRDMRIIRANRSAHEKFGYRFGELRGKRCYKAFYGKDAPCEGCPVLTTIDTHQKSRGLKRVSKTGQTFDISGSPVFDDHGQLSMIAHVARDITSKLKRQQEHARLVAAVDQTTDGILIFDPHGTIQYSNPAFSQLTGYSQQDVAGSNLSMLKGHEFDEASYQALWAQLSAGKGWKGRFICKKKDNTSVSTETTIFPIFDESGVTTSFVSVKRDISKEEALEKQLQQTLKLEAIGTLAGGIAHDFNNILSTMLGYAYMAKGQLEKDASAHNALDHIIKSGDRAAELIKQLLSFSRNEQQAAGVLKPLKLQYIIKEALKLTRSSLPATIKLSQNIDTHCPPIVADAAEMHQVLINIMTNASQAIHNTHGTIHVTLSHDRTRNQVQLGISDSGSGMDDEAVKRIFDPFYSTNPRHLSSGLGLSVVHGIVKRHNGTIEVTSVTGKGTTFTLSFPVAPSLKTNSPAQCSTDDTNGKEHILIVDDEPQLIEVLTYMLTRKGYAITAFTSSIEALKHFRHNAELFDLVITDMTMPDMTGVELAREILALHPQLPIILTTGYSKSINRRKALRIGIQELMQKPLRKAELEQTIRRVLDNG